jgi:Ribbon-helix-helix protein, copG family
MGQITIYLDDETSALVKAGVKASGVSQSQWIAEAVRQRVRREWPASVRALAGAWLDFPTAEEIRKHQAADVHRERL